MKTEDANQIPDADEETKGFVAELAAPLRDLTKPAAKVLEALAGPTAQGIATTSGNVFGGLIGDRIHHWRQRNLIDTLEKTARHIELKGICLEDARALPDGELYAIFDGASKADEPDVQEMWAALLTSTLKEGVDQIEVKQIAGTLGQLGGTEAHMLLFLEYAWGWERKLHTLRRKRGTPTLGNLGDPEILAQIETHNVNLRTRSCEDIGDHGGNILGAISNLQRLGCVTRNVAIGDANDVISELDMGSMEGISFNEHGLALVKASSFITMIEDITTQIHMLSGLHETYGDTDIVNPDDAYKPVRYALTDYGHKILFYCNPT